MIFPLDKKAAVNGLDQAINRLTEIKNRLTDENFNHFSIEIEENHDLFEAVMTSKGETGFRQMKPNTLIVTVMDTSNLGSEFYSTEIDLSLWRAPTREEISAIDEKMKTTKKFPKAKRERIASKWRRVVKPRPRSFPSEPWHKMRVVCKERKV